MKLFAESKQVHGFQNQTCAYQRGNRGSEGQIRRLGMTLRKIGADKAQVPSLAWELLHASGRAKREGEEALRDSLVVKDLLPLEIYSLDRKPYPHRNSYSPLEPW